MPVNGKCCNISHVINSVQRALVKVQKDARSVLLQLCTEEVENVPCQVDTMLIYSETRLTATLHSALQKRSLPRIGQK